MHVCLLVSGQLLGFDTATSPVLLASMTTLVKLLPCFFCGSLCSLLVLLGGATLVFLHLAAGLLTPKYCVL